MNLANIERMIRDGDLSREALQFLLGCRGECEWLDYKESLHLDSDRELCNFGRDIVAMKNMGGGYIVVGVRDKSWEQIGLDIPLPYDTKELRDKVRRATGLQLDVDIVHHDYPTETKTKIFAVIFVRASRKRNKRRAPTVLAKDFCHTQAYGLRRGEIYARDGDSTVRVSSQEQLVTLLNRLEDEADAESLHGDTPPSPFAVDDGTYRLLPRGFDTFVGRLDAREGILDALVQDPRIWIVNVHGPGGVGKSALVNWAAYEFYGNREFEAILQLTAKETILTDTGIRANGRSLYSLDNLFDHILALFQESTDRRLSEKRTVVLELLTAWKTLLILDNMETVSDGRVLEFVQKLPPSTRSKVLLTSRFKTGAWELPIPISELRGDEVREFLQIKAKELGIAFPIDAGTSRRVEEVSGGLPLAIQWILGEYKITRRLSESLKKANDKDSPVLEFSFRNIWTSLSPRARTVLAVLSIFDDAEVTVQQLGIATELRVDAIENALEELGDVTLVTRFTQRSDGRTLFSALPITLAFARHQLAGMGDFEVNARRRVKQFDDQLNLQASEVNRFRANFSTYGITSENERRAAILCSRAQSESFAGRTEEAELMFQQARDLAPTSAYVHAMSASFELGRGAISEALSRADEACRRATNKTGALCYSIKAEIYDRERNRSARLAALERAIEYDPGDQKLRHQRGVALSRLGREAEAVDEFTAIIEREKLRSPSSNTYAAALATRIINLQRLNRTEQMDQDLRDAATLLRDFPSIDRNGKLRELVEEGVSRDTGQFRKR